MYNSSYQPSFGGQQVQSQYRGFQKTFQPTGYVQSYYQPQKSFQSSGASAQSYHMSNYAGNRQNHDAQLREDSRQPSSYASGRAQGMGSMSSFNASSFQSYQPSQSYHLANYRGNQQDHDARLREDSQSPSSFSGQSMSAGSYHLSNYRGNQQDHDAQLREDSMRASSYAFGSQGMSTLNQGSSGFRTQ